MRAAIDVVCRNLLENLKSRLAVHKCRLAVTLDEWKSSNNYDFLAVTLHFHNDEFELEKFESEKFVTGLKILNDDLSQTGEVLYGHLNRVLFEYGIEDRIISITRDNAAPINTMIDVFKNALKK